MNSYDQDLPALGEYPSLQQVAPPLIPPIDEREYLGELWFDEFPDDTTIPMIIGEDGMPQFVPQELALAPEFNPSTFICVADETEFLLMDGNGHLLQSFAPEEVSEDGFVPFSALSETARIEARNQLIPQFLEQAKIEALARKDAIRIALVDGKFLSRSGQVVATFEGRNASFIAEDGTVPFSALKDEAAQNEAINFVIPQIATQLADNKLMDPSLKVKLQPKRPACQFYHAQVIPAEFNTEKNSIVRLCTALATTNGSVYNIRDSKVLACTMRQDQTTPKDRYSLKVVRDFEIKAAKLHAETVVEDDKFEVPDTAGGIFGNVFIAEEKQENG